MSMSLSVCPNLLYQPLFMYESPLYLLIFPAFLVGQEAVFTNYSRWAHMIHKVIQV